MSIIAISVIIAICSVLMYSFESKEQPEVFKNGFSGIWYSIQTMIEVDVDFAPITQIGQALSTLMLLLCGCLFGVPVAIIATGFEDMIAEQAGVEKEEDKDLYEVLRGYDNLSDKEKERFQRMVQADETNETQTE